jgi:hypothetical protein
VSRVKQDARTTQQPLSALLCPVAAPSRPPALPPAGNGVPGRGTHLSGGSAQPPRAARPGARPPRRRRASCRRRSVRTGRTLGTRACSLACSLQQGAGLRSLACSRLERAGPSDTPPATSTAARPAPPPPPPAGPARAQGGRRLCPGDPPRVAALVQSAGAPRCHLAILSPAGRRAGWLPLPGSQLECAEKPAGERSPAAESPKSPGFPESVRPVDPDFPRRSTPRPRAPRQTGPTRPSTDLAEPAATRARGTAVLAACSKGGGVCSENEL